MIDKRILHDNLGMITSLQIKKDTKFLRRNSFFMSSYNGIWAPSVTVLDTHKTRSALGALNNSFIQAPKSASLERT